LIAAVRAKNVDDVKWFLDASANKDAKDEVLYITNTDYSRLAVVRGAAVLGGALVTGMVIYWL
jgi:hypothetical protein